MKRLFTLLLISFVALSCEMIDEKLDDLLGKRDWVVFAESTELSVDVPSKQTVLNYKFESTLDWAVKTEAEWLEIDPTSGKAGKDIKIQIKVAKNKDKEGRTGYADLTLSNDESYRITINQAGEGDENDDIVVDIPNNQIWYTSIDGEIVEPYSDEDDIHDNFTVFGANIISNEYDTEKECWVITFDGDVTEVGYMAFYGCDTLTSVTIPNSVTTIGDLAFRQCNSLTSVQIGEGVTTIGNLAFCECRSLISVTIPDSVTTIGNLAFCECRSLISVTIPDSVTIIGCETFSECDSLTSVQIGDSVTTIGVWAFSLCSSLTSITIPDSVTIIEGAAFRKCHSLMEFNGKFASEDSRCLIVDGVLNSFAPAGLTEYTISDRATTIGENAFSWCESLTSVTIPDSVTTIGEGAFSYCSSLTSVYCKPTTPPAGGYDMFSDNASDRKIYVPMESVEAYKSANYWSDYADRIVAEEGAPEDMLISIIRYTTTDSTIATPQNMNIKSNTYVDGEGVLEFYGDTIGYNAFSSCSSLTSVTIGDSVTTIEIYAFQGCSSLESITIPDSITTIGKSAFYECVSIKNIVIPNSVTSIGDFAFGSCSSLTSVTIPDSVTTLGDAVFRKCSSLTSVNIPNGVTTIRKSTFYGCTSLANIVIPDSVTEIGEFAFAWCSNLTSVTIPNSVTSLGANAFKSCTNVQMFNGKFASDSGRCLIVNGVLNSFAIGCGAMEYTIPAGVTTIGESAFSHCTSLTSVTIPDSVTTIGDDAFFYCSSLTSVTIPDGVTTIGNEAFYNCDSLTSVYFKAITPPAGGSDMFYKNASGRKIYVPMESVEAYKSASGWSDYADDIVGYDF